MIRHSSCQYRSIIKRYRTAILLVRLNSCLLLPSWPFPAASKKGCAQSFQLTSKHIDYIHPQRYSVMPAVVSTAARASTAPSKVATDRDHPSTALPAAVTGIDEAVSAATEQARIDARRRIQLALLPENAFSLLRDQRGKQRTTAAATKSTNGSTAGGFLSDDGVVPRNSHQRVVSAPTAAAVSADDNNKGVKIGVGEALDRWALQT